MPLTSDMPSASRRHCIAADTLDGTHRRDVAGYLYGIAAECAVKAMMQEAGIAQLPLEFKRDDPYFAHFPHLKTMLRDKLAGRKGAVLRRFIENDHFFSQWEIQLRYCRAGEISDRWVDSWKEQAHQAVASIGTLG